MDTYSVSMQSIEEHPLATFVAEVGPGCYDNAAIMDLLVQAGHATTNVEAELVFLLAIITKSNAMDKWDIESVTSGFLSAVRVFVITCAPVSKAKQM